MNNSEVKKYGLDVCLVVDALISQIDTGVSDGEVIAGFAFAGSNQENKELMALISKATGISIASFYKMNLVSISGIRSDLLEYISKFGVADGFSLGGYVKSSGNAEVVGVVVSGFSGVNFSGPGCSAASSNKVEDIKVSGMKLKYTLEERLKIIDGIAMTLNYAELDDDIKLKLTEKLNMVIDSI